jgi:hypothetical protein
MFSDHVRVTWYIVTVRLRYASKWLDVSDVSDVPDIPGSRCPPSLGLDIVYSVFDHVSDLVIRTRLTTKLNLALRVFRSLSRRLLKYQRNPFLSKLHTSPRYTS